MHMGLLGLSFAFIGVAIAAVAFAAVSTQIDVPATTLKEVAPIAIEPVFKEI